MGERVKSMKEVSGFALTGGFGSGRFGDCGGAEVAPSLPTGSLALTA